MQRSLSDIATRIRPQGHGLWVCNTLANVSFPEEGNRYCFAVEDRSFWFQHRNECLIALLKQFPAPGRFFDVGGGNGCVAKALEMAGLDVVLIEPGAEGVQNAQKRGVKQIVWGTVEDAGLQPASLPALGLFDVLEHIEDDARFLRGLYDLQPAGGRMYITVPALRALWSREEHLAGHWRRYTVQSLNRALEQAGYVVEFNTYFFSFLVIPIFLLRSMPYRLGMGRQTETEAGVRADHKVASGGGLLRWFMDWELKRVMRGQRIFLGSSCVAVARRS